MLHLAWPSRDVTTQTKPSKPITPRRKRSTEPTPFVGLTQKPLCARCEQATRETAPLLPVRPNPMPATHRRPYTVETSKHFCLHTDCDYRGWLGLFADKKNKRPFGAPPAAPRQRTWCRRGGAGGGRGALQGCLGGSRLGNAMAK